MLRNKQSEHSFSPMTF